MLAELSKQRIVVVLRHISLKHLESVAESLVAGGIQFLEVTFGRDDTLAAIKTLRERFSGRAFIGAGTVLNTTMAEQALQAGAEFLLAPGMNQAKEIIQMAHHHGTIAVPGAMTPTEIQQAIEWQADAVKIFPAITLGPEYIKHISAPLQGVKLIPTGGVNLSNIRDFLHSGAFAVGVGGNLVDSESIARGDFETLKETARQYVEAIKQFKTPD